MNLDANARVGLQEGVRRGTHQRRREDSRIPSRRALSRSAPREDLPPHQGPWAALREETHKRQRPQSHRTEQAPNRGPWRTISCLPRSLQQRRTRRESEFHVSPAEPAAGRDPWSSSPRFPREEHGGGGLLPPSSDLFIERNRQYDTRQLVTTYRLTFHYLQVSSEWDDASKNTKVRK